MLSKFSIFILLIIFQVVTVFSQDKPELLVDDNLLTIKIPNMAANCCSAYISDYHINSSSNIITITLTDTTVQKCRCSCNFEFNLSIGPLPQGKYSVIINKEEFIKYGYSKDKKILIGKGEVWVTDPNPKTPLSMDFKQSPCLNSNSNQNNEEPLKGAVEIYPNPAVGAVSLRFNLRDNSDVNIKILNFLGKEIDNYKFRGLKQGINTLHLAISDMPPGMYIGKILSNTGQSLTFKIMWSK